MMVLLMFLIVGPAVISPLMELVEFGAELRICPCGMDQIDDVLKLEADSRGEYGHSAGLPCAVLPRCQLFLSESGGSLAPHGAGPCEHGDSGGQLCCAGGSLRRRVRPRRGSCWPGFGTWRAEASHRRNGYPGLYHPGADGRVAFVFQDTYIFAESVYDNIAMHRDVGREAVEQAARAAAATSLFCPSRRI